MREGLRDFRDYLGMWWEIMTKGPLWAAVLCWSVIACDVFLVVYGILGIGR